MIQSLLQECLFSVPLAAVAAGTSAQTTTAIDMGATPAFDAVAFFCSLATVTDASVLTLTAYEIATNTNSGGTAVTGGATTAFTAATSSAGFLLVDVVRPGKRYVYATLTRTTQNAAINCIVAVQYRARAYPTTQGAAMLASILTVPSDV